MRVIAGTHKGQVFDAPTGTNTRPTTDRVREAIFSALVSEVGSLEGMRVCDAFAGSGAFGIEALSRGAAEASFFEKDAKTAGLVRKNIAKLGFKERAKVVVIDTLKAPYALSSHGPFDLLFLDPPYRIASGEITKLISELIRQNALVDKCVIMYEHAKQEHVSAQPELEVLKEKTYGDTTVTFLKVKRG